MSKFFTDFHYFDLSPEIQKSYRAPETQLLKNLVNFIKPELTFSSDNISKIKSQAHDLISKVRAQRLSNSGLDAFMAQYDLSSFEGITLMCLAEALLRIPDSATVDYLIQDKISQGNWEEHFKKSPSFFVNAATWSLMLTGKILDPKRWPEGKLKKNLSQFLNKNSKATIRQAVKQAMKILGTQFVMGEAISDALKRAEKQEAQGYLYSYDMLGEAAYTQEDAQHYFKTYEQAIHEIGQKAQKLDTQKLSPKLSQKPGISIKLSALHPRYEVFKRERVLSELLARTKDLCLLAQDYDISLTIDAEESERLELSLELIEKLALDPDLKSWQGLGLAVQAYQKRAFYVLDFLINLAKKSEKRLMVRLVKGAYWDSEIKKAQVLGLANYPVFTRKIYTDVSYLTCAKKILDNTQYIYPMFATHNAYTLSVILNMAKNLNNYSDFEFQCLHGMGAALYDHIVGKNNLNIPCRIYAPVGTHKHLLAYLVRRLLENGANSSFVNRIMDEQLPIEALLENPLDQAKNLDYLPHPKIPSPEFIYGASRMNAKGIDLSDPLVLEQLKNSMSDYLNQNKFKNIQASPLISNFNNLDNLNNLNHTQDITNPATGELIGQIRNTSIPEVNQAISQAQIGFKTWSETPAFQRAECLNKLADLLENNMPELLALCIKEAGKTLSNSIGEIREAIDFCRYYAAECLRLFSQPTLLPGPTGERNLLSLHGRGIFVCISPWNFPLAIFLGQITAALAAGNSVLAKPAEQTPLIAYVAVKLLHQAGVPENTVQFLPGPGETIGAALTQSEKIHGVIFTGSNQTAQMISQTLAQKSGPIATLIAETGGQNCMVVDSSALPEQVVRDVLSSAFDSAGQRCSALRVLYLQEEISPVIIKMLTGALAELSLGDPSLLSTDIGPVIDQEAQKNLQAHIDLMKVKAELIFELKNLNNLNKNYFINPAIFKIKSIKDLTHEVFGPVLHIIEYKESELDKVIEEINSTGFGLTFGIHSRITQKVSYLAQNIRAGNIYINRNMIGAVVGVQPFGGEGLSGTGFKAGGPHYLLKLCTERCMTEDTTASGGNASLMSLEEN